MDIYVLDFPNNSNDGNYLETTPIMYITTKSISKAEVLDFEKKKIKSIHTELVFEDDDTIETIKRKIGMEIASNIQNKYDSITIDDMYLVLEQKMDFQSAFSNEELEMAYRVFTKDNKIDISTNSLEPYLRNFVDINTKKQRFEPEITITSFQQFIEYLQEQLPIVYKKQILGLLFENTTQSQQHIFPIIPQQYNTAIIPNAVSLKDDSGSFLYKYFSSDVKNKPDYKILAFIKNANTLNKLSDIYFLKTESKSIPIMDTVKEYIQQYKSIQLYKQNASSEIHDTLVNTHKLEEGLLCFTLYLLPIEKSVIPPLDVIFKNIHASKLIPMILYKTKNANNNLYRLYCDKTSTNGKKIPLLPKKDILKFLREIMKNTKTSGIKKSIIGNKRRIKITLVMRWDNGETNTPEYFYLDFKENGVITIYTEFNSPISLEQLQNKLRTVVQPLLHQTNQYIEHIGFQIRSIKSILDNPFTLDNHFTLDTTSNTCIFDNISYQYQTVIPDGIHLQKLIQASPLLFDIYKLSLTSPIQKSAELRYIRISNYHKMQDKFIFALLKIDRLGMQNAENTKKEIEEGLKNKYPELKPVEINTIVEDAFTEYIQHGTNQLQYVGFPVTMDLDYRNKLTITCSDISSLQYLYFMHTYIISLLYLQFYDDAKFSEILDMLKKSKIVHQPQPQPVQNKSKSKSKSKSDSDYSDSDSDSEEEYNNDLFLFDIQGQGASMKSSNINTQETSSNVISSVIDSDIVDDLGNDDIFAFSQNDEIVGKNDDLFLLGDFEEDDSDNSDVEDIPVIVEKEKVKVKEKEKEKVNAFVNKNEKENKKQTDKDKEYSKYFLNRLTNTDPTLFEHSDKNFKAYSTICQGYKQPVVMTQKEKDEIDKREKDLPIKSYGQPLLHGSSKDNQNWYVCPRFWCIKENRSLTIDEANNPNVCGGIMKSKKIDDEISKGNFVYEFVSPNDKNIILGHVQHYPHLTKQVNPNGIQYPCCYVLDATDKEKATGKGHTKNEYISKLFPLKPNTWGYLHPSIELFFQMEHPVNTKNIPFLLRYGLEMPQQSFLGAMADIYEYLHNKYDKNNTKTSTPTHNQFLEILSKSVTLDVFLKLHNGSLVTTFQPIELEKAIQRINIDDYQTTKFYNSLSLNDPEHLRFLKNTIASYENYMGYLHVDTIAKPHNYLWDLFVMEIDGLMPIPINLVILELVEQDTRSVVRIVCPTNTYSSVNYNDGQETVLLYMENGMYEPIYLYTDIGGGKTQIVKTFSSKMKTLPVALKHMLHKIHINSDAICKTALPSDIAQKQKSIKMKKTMPLFTIYSLIQEVNKYVVVSQIRNYSSKIIGLLVVTKNNNNNRPRFFIPCSPSAYLDIIPIQQMDTNSIWIPFQDTLEEITEFYEEHNKKIPCNPLYIVVDEENIIFGILTETNQLIEVQPDGESIYSEELHKLPKIVYSTSPYTIDKVYATSTTNDEVTQSVTQPILLEGQFYSAFRSTVRYCLSMFSNRKLRFELLQLCNNMTYTYESKIKRIRYMLYQLVKTFVKFSLNADKALKQRNVSSCIGYDKEQCLKTDYCANVANGTGTDVVHCVLLLPMMNLVNPTISNKEYYFTRLADNILRYHRIRHFMLENTINLTDIQYHINNDELVIFGTEDSTNAYFTNVGDVSSFYNTIETAEPFSHASILPTIPIKIENVYVRNKENKIKNNSDDFVNNVSNEQCIIHLKPIIGNALSDWKTHFKTYDNAQEMMFSNKNVICSYQVLQYISFIFDLSLETVDDVKKKLIDGYKEYINDANMLLSILVLLGRGDAKFDWNNKKIELKSMSSTALFVFLNELILSDEYFITDIDIWIFSNKLKVPVVLFTAMKSLSFIRNLYSKALQKKILIPNIILSGNPDSDAYLYIRSPVLSEPIPDYSAITVRAVLSDWMKTKISVISFPDFIKEISKNAEEYKKWIQ